MNELKIEEKNHFMMTECIDEQLIIRIAWNLTLNTLTLVPREP